MLKLSVLLRSDTRRTSDEERSTTGPKVPGPGQQCQIEAPRMVEVVPKKTLTFFTNIIIIICCVFL